jgi:hypothetical protein
MFEDVSTILAHNPPGLHSGVAVVLLDGVRQSIVVAGFAGPNRVLSWVNGKLREVASPELADESQHALGVAAGDIDGDGREELYVLNAEPFASHKRNADRLFKQTADQRWEDLFERPANRGMRNFNAGQSVAVIDRRGVGRYGFFVANYNRPARLYELAPGGAIADLAPALDIARTSSAKAVLTLPVFSAYPDIFCTNEHGQNFAYRNRGDGTFDEVAKELRLRDCDEHGRGVAVLDTGSEFSLAWGNAEGPHRLMSRNGTGEWKDYATPGLAFPTAARNVIAADFDNDGHDEVFFHNFGEANRLFRVLPTRDELQTAMLDPGEAFDPDGFATGAAICDIDGDGILELILSRGEHRAQPLAVYKARAASPNWLRVRPLTRFGAPARGAVVRAEYGGRIRVKGICGGSGLLCQMEPIAHFGLGECRRVESVSVTWPDGHSVGILNPGSNRVLTIPYPRG